MALWSGRFSGEQDDLAKQFNASISLDRRLYKEDIDGSIAHVAMLAQQGIIADAEKTEIITALEEIRQEVYDWLSEPLPSGHPAASRGLRSR